jgi:hypothetical protein
VPIAAPGAYTEVFAKMKGDDKKRIAAAREAVNKALNETPINDREITLGYLREAMVLAFLAGVDWQIEQRD